MFGGSVLDGLPLIGEQFSQAALGMITDAGEDVAQVRKGIQAQPFRGGDQTGQYGGGPTAIVAAIERPVAATDCDATQAALGAVVVDLQITVVQVAG